MRSPKQHSVRIDQPAGEVFRAALGVMQHTKSATVLAVHNDGRMLVVRDKPKMSNAKFFQVLVEEQGAAGTLSVLVGTDPRTPKAILDGKFNQKSLDKYVEAVQAALDGTRPAPATPVENHYLQGDTVVPWVDSTQEPEIEVGGNLRAAFGL